jgi:hypothetical protein
MPADLRQDAAEVNAGRPRIGAGAPLPRPRIPGVRLRAGGDTWRSLAADVHDRAHSLERGVPIMTPFFTAIPALPCRAGGLHAAAPEHHAPRVEGALQVRVPCGQAIEDAGNPGAPARWAPGRPRFVHHGCSPCRLRPGSTRRRKPAPGLSRPLVATERVAPAWTMTCTAARSSAETRNANSATGRNRAGFAGNGAGRVAARRRQDRSVRGWRPPGRPRPGLVSTKYDPFRPRRVTRGTCRQCSLRAGESCSSGPR